MPQIVSAQFSLSSLGVCRTDMFTFPLHVYVCSLLLSLCVGVVV